MLRHHRSVWAVATMLMLAALSAAGDTKVDRAGDPLPDGAKARMGTTRWRHAGPVNFVAFPSETTVLTASQDYTVRIWERATGKELHRFKLTGIPQMPGGRPGGLMVGMGGFGNATSHVTLSGDGKTLAAIQAGEIQFWDVAAGKELRRIKVLPPIVVNDMILSADGKLLAFVAADRSIRVVNAENGDMVCQVKAAPRNNGPLRLVLGGGQADVSGFAFSPDGKTLASVLVEFGQQKTTYYLRLTNTANGDEIRKTEAAGGVSSIVFAPNGKMVAYGSGNSIVLAEAGTGKEIRTLQNTAALASLVFSPDSDVIAAKGRDQKVRIFDATDGKKLHEVGHTPAPTPGGGNLAFIAGGLFGGPETRDIAFSHDGKTIGVGGNQAPRFYDVGTGKEQNHAGGHKAGVSSVVITPDGKTMLSRGSDHVIRTWNAASGEELGQFDEPSGTSAVAISPGGKTVALANADATIRIHSLETGKEIHKFKGHPNGVAALTFSTDGKSLASRGNFDSMIRIFDVARGSETRSITVQVDAPANPGGGFGRVNAGAAGQGIAFSPDGASIAVSVNGTFALPAGGGIRPQRMALSGGLIRVFDISTGRETRHIKLPPQGNVAALAYSPDGRLLASDNGDRTYTLWEVASAKERAVLGEAGDAEMQGGAVAGGDIIIVGNRVFGQGAPSTRASIAFSPSGDLLVTRAGNDVEVWDVSLAKNIATFKGHTGPVGAVAFSPDGKSAASGSADTTILVWDVARIKRAPKAAVALKGDEVKSLWADLISSDAAKVRASIRTLTAGAKDAVPFLRDQIKPAAAVDAKKIEQWVTDLDSGNFPKRTKAAAELEKIGELARPALTKILDSNPTPETRRRIEPLLEKLITGTLTIEQVQIARAVEALEKSGSADARQLLQSLSQGAAGAHTTREAQNALSRMDKARR